MGPCFFVCPTAMPKDCSLPSISKVLGLGILGRGEPLIWLYRFFGEVSLSSSQWKSKKRHQNPCSFKGMTSRRWGCWKMIYYTLTFILKNLRTSSSISIVPNGFLSHLVKTPPLNQISALHTSCSPCFFSCAPSSEARDRETGTCHKGGA